ncbi:MAG: DUF370 domain-containing protein [Armatimonadota bacterium]|nr:DUF370 domain-containing protein [bacterium]
MSVFSIGFGNYVSRERVIAIVSTDSSPIKRAVQEARKEGNLIDATQGRKTKSAVFMDDGRLVLSGLGPETLAKRVDALVTEEQDADLG